VRVRGGWDNCAACRAKLAAQELQREEASVRATTKVKWGAGRLKGAGSGGVGSSSKRKPHNGDDAATVATEPPKKAARMGKEGAGLKKQPFEALGGLGAYGGSSSSSSSDDE
jgi:hypothetical protein